MKKEQLISAIKEMLNYHKREIATAKEAEDQLTYAFHYGSKKAFSLVLGELEKLEADDT